MQFDELEVLRKQNELLLQRITELEMQNTKHMAMLQIIAEKEKGDT